MDKAARQQLKEYVTRQGSEEGHKKGTTVVEQGRVSDKFYYLAKGLLRGWVAHDGQEVTFQFLFEDQFFCSTESFFHHCPCRYFIETMETSSIVSIGKKQMDVLQKDVEFLRLFNSYLISRTAAYQDLLISRIRDKPETRYKNLLAEHPEILLRIPQHYIASYLGITAVSLSRIRNRR